MNIGKTGKSGEDKVAAFLRSKGYKIIKRNYSCRFGEIDIIAEENEYIVFVEVKTRKQNSIVSGADAVDYRKQQRIMLTAEDFIAKTECVLQPRFDVATVICYEKENGQMGFNLEYFKNAF